MNKDVIIACDFESKKELESFLSNFNESLFLKIGMELFYQEGPSIIKYVKSLGHKVFLDLKLHDIPNTVYKAMLNIKKLDVEFVTIHAAGGFEMMQKASLALENSNTKALAVTVLTSIDDDILNNELNVKNNIIEQVRHLALLSKKAGIYGVICSPLEVEALKKEDIVCVTPGIRIDDNKDDQKRVMSPSLARKAGSDYIVVGRSITNSDNVVKAYHDIKKQFKGE